MTPQEVIELIQKQKLSAGEGNLKTIAGEIDRLQKAFPRYGSFLMEFIQNADDAKSSKIRIELSGSTVKISNDGMPFTEENVKSICDVAGSTKSPEDYIGYLGVGFKSVFIVSDCSRICSGEFKFKFDKKLCDRPKAFPWQIVPYWCDDEVELERGFSTAFILEIKNTNLVEKIREEFKPDNVNERILLFLRNVREIRILDTDKQFERVIQKLETSQHDDYRIVRVEQRIGQTSPCFSDWLIFRQPSDVPTEVGNDYVTIEWERNLIRKREVIIAFRLTEHKKLVPEPKSTAHIGVFSFLPLKEIQSGLKFLLQADFLTTPGRGELARDCKWNEWLADCCYKVVVYKCIPCFQKDEHWKYNYSSILTSESEGGGHELFKKYLIVPLEKEVMINLRLVAEDDTLIRVNQGVVIKEPIRNLYDSSDLQQLFPDKKVIHKDCEFNQKDNRIILLETEPEEFFLSENGAELLKRKTSQKDVEWFIKLYGLFVSYYDYCYFKERWTQYNVRHNQFWDRFQNYSVQIILTDQFDLANINDCFANPNMVSIPESLGNKPRIVHSSIYDSQPFQNFLRKLNEERFHSSPPSKKVIETLTKDEIKNRIFKEELNNLNEQNWSQYKESEKIDKVKGLKQLYVKKWIKLDEFGGKLTLKTKDNQWKKPEEIVFSDEYRPKHSLESVVTKELCDREFCFLSSVYLKNHDINHIKEWSNFFIAIGVDSLLDENKEDTKNIVERIAILSTLKYEKLKGRTPVERDASAEKVGWDVDSADRRIEVKGTSKASGYDLILSKNEQRALYNEKDYYIYIVSNALSKPLLSVISGKNLLESKDSEDVKLNFTYKAWNETTNARTYEYQF